MAELDASGRLQLTEEDLAEMQRKAEGEVDMFATHREAKEQVREKIFGPGGLMAQAYNEAEAKQG